MKEKKMKGKTYLVKDGDYGDKYLMIDLDQDGNITLTRFKVKPSYTESLFSEIKREVIQPLMIDITTNGSLYSRLLDAPECDTTQ